MVPALLDNPDRDIWRRRDHDAVDRPPRYRRDIPMTRDVLDTRRVGVDGKHVVPGAAQFTEDRVGSLTRLSGNTGDGDPSTPKKCRD